MSLLENNSICKDGGGIHYQQLGWNDNTHYTAISLHKAANGSNHSTLINKTLSFVSTWRASSIFHWDSYGRALAVRGPIFWLLWKQCQSLYCVLAALLVMQELKNKSCSEWKNNQLRLFFLLRCTKWPPYICRRLSINTDESMITLPGVFKSPHPIQFWDYTPNTNPSTPHPLAFSTVQQWGTLLEEDNLRHFIYED